MKLGILGGSFNPVHNGHLYLADTAISSLKLDRIVFIPAYRSPFKLGAEGMESGVNDRLDMLAAAVENDARYTVDSCETRREGISYTVDTLEDIIYRFLPEGKPVLIIGDDIADEFPKWHESEKILKLADIAVARRINSRAVKYPYPHIIIDNEIMDISSHDIRGKIKEGKNWRSLVPGGVRAVIEDRNLYDYCFENSAGGKAGRKQTETQYAVSGEDCTNAVIQRIENIAREMLTTERFLHSRCTAVHARDMCIRFGIDPNAGYLAGIAHDIAKQLDNKKIIKIVKSEKLVMSAIEKGKPNLLHGKAASILLRDNFGIRNKDVLEAVAFHTSGCENMGPLAKIIYIADKTESTRNIDPALKRMCRESDLDSVLIAVLEKTIGKLKARELDLSADTILLLEKIRK
ncbi:MAG: nicotinate (nicotinamide) nucleotide adenylyltransferase [Treponema sp.]|nr:nicotinate (nicotinamide) nucleotide adenylyltransferase [Treponema sp.]